ncbi:MAG: hypothetical protein OKBPIBMD_01584 [Chlorobi bacterium]|nr:MAG: hypothetical protein F9K28_03295 [Bacteroidota bacterium]KXK34594.1 MAG: hypothetical protein UZ06_CHB003001057 [Chlorobi bacterium OLB6]MBV6464132.1 hypothetical protein [Chlorobiota bacterium]MBW7852858.1 hypothetical protein [Candidatus Kapabacteria bacterium]MCC6330911.1 hypothetical protein [Ignavibacteria bacterium]
MYRSSLFALLVLLGTVLHSCTIVNRQQQAKPPQTQLQVRSYQTREFDTNDVKLVMKAVLNTLQDDGFVVKNAVVDLGLLTATKELQITTGTRPSSSANDDYWEELFSQIFKKNYKTRANSKSTEQQRYNKFKVIEASVNISEIGTRCKVRANFLAKILDNTGDPTEVYTIDDQKFYQDFFAKVDKGVFIEKQGL